MHDIKNSEDFVKNLESVEIPPTRKIVSYDVSGLFTSIPVDQTVQITQRRLETSLTDVNSPDVNSPSNRRYRCELSIQQVIYLLEFCISPTTYSVWRGVYYREIQGTPMGSPVAL